MGSTPTQEGWGVEKEKGAFGALQTRERVEANEKSG